MKRNFINLSDFSKDQLMDFIHNGIRFKKHKFSPKQILTGQTMALLFDKKSTRTRMSFEVGMKQLGGHTLLLDSMNMHAEPVYDMANVYSRYVDCIVARVSSHQFLTELAKLSSIPVVNAMTDESHPCQILAHLMTLVERGFILSSTTISWFGDHNNVSKTFFQASKIFGYKFLFSGPKSALNDNAIDLVSPIEAAKAADVIVTDTWSSMGQERTEDEEKVFLPYQVNKTLLEVAKKDVIFSHCMPIYRGKEVADDVLRLSNAVHFDEAENRLHIQKVILSWALEDSGVSIS